MNPNSSLAPISVGVDDAARLIGVARSMFYEMIASGEIETFKLGRTQARTGENPGSIRQATSSGKQPMSLRRVGLTGNVLDILVLPGTVLLVDLEALRRLGAHRIELMTAKVTKGTSN